MASLSSVWPLPSTPATPRISPAVDFSADAIEEPASRRGRHCEVDDRKGQRAPRVAMVASRPALAASCRVPPCRVRSPLRKVRR